MDKTAQRLNPQRALMELDYHQRWLCRGHGRIAIENIRPLRSMLELLFRIPTVRDRAEEYIRSIRLTTFEWRFDALPPAFGNYRILHLSDLHIDAIDGLPEAIHKTIRNSRPDLIVLTGDYRFETGGNIHLVLEYMQHLMDGLPRCDGIFGILGNHDTGEFVEPFEAMGMRMLINESCILRRGADCIGLIGLDDCHYYGADDLEKALHGMDPGLFRILLVHSPELFHEARCAGIDFYLCGHTHGGQIRLPLFGAPITNAACPRRFSDRIWRHGGTQGYTHRGTGSSCIPFRLNCPPEATLHILNPGDSA